MKTINILLIASIVFLLLPGCSFMDSLTGEAGLDGSGGLAADNIPGGSFSVYSDNGNITAVSRVIIAFDPDPNILSGNEYLIIVPIGEFRNGSNINHTFTWTAPDVPPGSYFLYAWLDPDETEFFNEFSDQHVLFDQSGNLSYMSLTINASNGATEPNYIFWDDFAAEWHFSFFLST